MSAAYPNSGGYLFSLLLSFSFVKTGYDMRNFNPSFVKQCPVSLTHFTDTLKLGMKSRLQGKTRGEKKNLLWGGDGFCLPQNLEQRGCICLRLFGIFQTVGTSQLLVGPGFFPLINTYTLNTEFSSFRKEEREREREITHQLNCMGGRTIQYGQMDFRLKALFFFFFHADIFILPFMV